MEKLGLEKGKDINQSVYTNPETLLKKASYGGITIESEAEIILVNPNKVVVKEVGTQTESDELKSLKEQIEEKSSKIARLSRQSEELSQQVKGLEIERDKYKQQRDNRPNITLRQYIKISNYIEGKGG
jgi:hypothetical protein